MSKSGRSHFQPGDGPRRGLLCDCKTSNFAKVCIQLCCRLHCALQRCDCTWDLGRDLAHHTASHRAQPRDNQRGNHRSLVTCHVSRVIVLSPDDTCSRPNVSIISGRRTDANTQYLSLFPKCPTTSYTFHY